MRRQHRSFVVTMIVVSLCCGFIGCKSNGGPWYKANSYTWHNPFPKFKKDSSFEDEDYGRYAETDNGIRMPSQGQTPDLSTPPGGYSEDRMAQNANINVPRTSGTNVGGYPQQQSQNTAVAMGNTQTQGGFAPQGQVAPAQYTIPNQQYQQNYSNGQQGNMQPATNVNYQQPGTNYQQQNTYNNTQSATPSYSQGQQQYYDQSYQGQGQNSNSTSNSNGYPTGQNNYYSDYSNDYHPGSR